MGSSVRLGASAIQPASAIILLACDQPAINRETIRSLIELHDRSEQAIVASQYSATLGTPALLAHSCFAELHNLPDDRGAKAVIQANLARVIAFDYPVGALDLDTPDDLRAWRMRTHLLS